MNYLRFWQASGESEKTSMRISSKIKQMMLDGLYTGGPVKYGYSLTESGLVNRKGAPIKKYRLAKFLNEKGYRIHTEKEFTSTRVNYILRVPLHPE